MATHHGKEGVVKLGSNAVAEVTEFEFSADVDTADDTAKGDSSRTHLVGYKSWEGSLSCHWDETDTNGQVVLVEGASVTLNLYPEGADSGDTYYGGTATVRNLRIASPLDGVVSASFNFQGNGAYSKTTV